MAWESRDFSYQIHEWNCVIGTQYDCFVNFLPNKIMSKERNKYLKNIKRARKELNKEWDSVRNNATVLGMEAGVNILRKNPKTIAIIGAGLTSFVVTQKLIKKNSNQANTTELETSSQSNFLNRFGDIGTKIFMQLVEGFLKKRKK